jgi:hypothetical protein
MKMKTCTRYPVGQRQHRVPDDRHQRHELSRLPSRTRWRSGQTPKMRMVSEEQPAPLVAEGQAMPHGLLYTNPEAYPRAPQSGARDQTGAHLGEGAVDQFQPGLLYFR